ncbi:MAG: diguanylate cyclase, partial [Leptolyngbyaceae bacterium]|nr:diguanylate cyclase [Leptolyngbyaceae bacterium]
MNRITPLWMNTRLGVRLSIAFGSITILLSAVLGKVSGNLAKAQIEQDISQDLTQIAYQMTGRLDQNMFERYREIQIIADLEPFRSAQTPDAEKRRVLEKLQETYPNYSWIGFANREGVVEVSVQSLLEGESVSQRDWFMETREDPYVGDVHEAVLLAKLLTNSSGDPLRFVDVASPVYDKWGGFQGVLGAHLSWQWAEEVKEKLLDVPAAEGKEILVVDRSNTVLLGPERWEGETLNLESLRLARLQGNGYVVEQWPDGHTYLVGFVESQGYRSYPGLGWTVLVQEPAATAFLPAQALHRQILIGGFVFGGGFAALGWLAASLMTKPLLQIAKAADQIRQGNRQVSLPQAKGQCEIARLSQALTQLLSSLFDQERSLQRSQQQLQQIVDGIEAPLLLREIGSGHLIFSNAGWARLCQRIEAVEQSPSAWLQHVHPGDRPWVVQKMAAEVQGTSFFNDEYRVVEPDGCIRWFWDRSYPIYDETGEIYRYISIKRDITELKHSSAMLQTLMEGTAAVTGRAFFEKLVQHLATALNADHVFVAEKVEHQLQTIAFWSQGQLQPNIIYSPDTVPCSFVLQDGMYCCKSQITQVFSNAPALLKLNAEGYVGVALTNADKQILGTLCAISETPLCDRTDYLTILQIFANRASAELERQRSETELLESEARFRLLAENVKDLVCLHDSSGRFLYLSPSCQSLLGYEPQELVGAHPYRYCHPGDRPLTRLQFQESLAEGTSSPLVYRARRKDGEYIWLETLLKVIPASQDDSCRFQTSSRDITDKINAQRQIEHDATHDSLTGLPNRVLLLERIELAIERAKRHDDFYFAVLFVNLDRFKVINESWGHRVGDELLQTTAHTLEGMVRGVDLVARLGSDEFALLIEEIDGPEAAIRLAEQIITTFKTALPLDGQDVVVSASVGIVFGSTDYTQEMNLLRDADIAVHSAKQKGGSCYVVFNQNMHQ